MERKYKITEDNMYEHVLGIDKDRNMWGYENLPEELISKILRHSSGEEIVWYQGTSRKYSWSKI